MNPIKVDLNQLKKDLATMSPKQLALKYKIDENNIGQLKGLKDDKELALRLTKVTKRWI